MDLPKAIEFPLPKYPPPPLYVLCRQESSCATKGSIPSCLDHCRGPDIQSGLATSLPLHIDTLHHCICARRYGDTADGMVESAFEFARICRKLDFHNFVFSMKVPCATATPPRAVHEVLAPQPKPVSLIGGALAHQARARHLSGPNFPPMTIFDSLPALPHLVSTRNKLVQKPGPPTRDKTWRAR